MTGGVQICSVRGILHTAFEIRQDGVSDAAGARSCAERIADAWRSLPLSRP